jgi:diguanylate cyclase (GGDEF)-like protein
VSSVVPESCSNPDLLGRWTACAENRDGSRYTQTQEATSLAGEVESSLSRRRPTPELAKAAREWGATMPSPSAVVFAVSSLREAVSMEQARGTALSQDSPETPNPEAADFESAVPEMVLQIIDRVMSEAIEGSSTSMRQAALTDPLTGCANRRALEDDLERAAAGANRTGLDVCVAVIDLDGLKQINDTNGHAAGDASLRELAVALRSAIRETDTVYRVGGDEFVVLMPYSGIASATTAMHRAREQGAPAFSWGAASLHMLSPTGNADELLDLADASLYASRRTARRTVAGWPRHRRKAMIGAAAAGVIGFGFSSAYVAYVFQPSSDQAVIGAPAASSGGQTKVARVGAKPVSPAPGGADLPPAGRDRRGDGSTTGSSKPARTGSNSKGGSKARIIAVPATPSGLLVVATVTPKVALHPKPTLVSITEPEPKLKSKPKLVVKPEPNPKLTSKPAPVAPPWSKPPTSDRGHGRCGQHRGGPPGPRRGWPRTPWQRRSPTWPRWFWNH